MREIIFRNLTTRNHRRRDLWIQETTNENGLHAEIQKRCVFTVKDHRRLSDFSNDGRCRLRNLTVTRTENSKTGTKYFFFKAIGSFYAVMGEEVFNIAFVQTYEVNLIASAEEEGGAWS